MIKKITILLLCVSLLLCLCACGASDTREDAAQKKEDAGLTFSVVTEVYEDSHTAADGTEILRESYELPRLELRTEEGEVYELSTSANNTPALLPREVKVRDAFNARMDEILAELRADSSEMVQSAEVYFGQFAGEEDIYACWVSELKTESVVQTSGGLVSVLASGYSYYGGAHPNTCTRTWNFDLTTGEFLTLEDFASSAGDLDGRSLADLIYFDLSRQVRENELDTGYFDDYDSYLRDFSSFAALNFTEDGLHVTFDTYTLAPYAIGAQAFTVPYSAFYNALSDHARELLDVPRAQLVLADFETAETLWIWLFMTTPPTGAAPDTVEIGGYTYLSAEIPDVSTLEDMRALLYRYFDAALADEWLAGEPARYAEVDGRLYVLSADRGSEVSMISDARSVALTEDGGVLTQVIGYGEWNEAAQEWIMTGEEETFEYPFTLVDGHAVFSAFPYPY